MLDISQLIIFDASFALVDPLRRRRSDFICPAHIVIPVVFSSLSSSGLPGVLVRSRWRFTETDGRAMTRTTKKPSPRTATAFYSYPSLLNYTIFSPKSTGKPLFYWPLGSYPQYFRPVDNIDRLRACYSDFICPVGMIIPMTLQSL